VDARIRGAREHVDEATDDQLMVWVRDGDPEPLAVLFERHQLPLYRAYA